MTTRAEGSSALREIILYVSAIYIYPRSSPMLCGGVSSIIWRPGIIKPGLLLVECPEDDELVDTLAMLKNWAENAP